MALTGRKVFFITAGAFSVIIGANLTLAVNAVGTFPGLETKHFPGLEGKNPYVVSQEFDADRTAQESLGWTVRAQAMDGLLELSITDADGAPVEARGLQAVVGRATHVADDMTPEFRFTGSTYIAPVTLGEGNWNLRMMATAADGTEFRQRVVLHVN